MFSKVNGKISAILVALSATAIPSNANASPITLTFPDHNVTIVGEFVGFQQNAYVIASDMGKLFVPASLVTCEGQDCFEIIASTDNNS